MSSRLRGICAAACLIFMGYAASLRASDTTAGSEAAASSMGILVISSTASSSQNEAMLPFDAQALLHPTVEFWQQVGTQAPDVAAGVPAKFSTLDLSAWPTSAVPHASPISGSLESEEPAPREDLMVPFPALGAGWVLLLGGVLCRIGARAIRPN